MYQKDRHLTEYVPKPEDRDNSLRSQLGCLSQLVVGMAAMISGFFMLVTLLLLF